MLSSVTTAAQDLQAYRKALRFPPDLEREFRPDFGERQPPMLQRFFALGLALYMSFAILDYFAVTTYYPTAWALRLVFGTGMLRLVFDTNSTLFKRNAVWLPSALTLWVGISILIMIYIARPDESAYLFYAFGLLLIIVAAVIGLQHFNYDVWRDAVDAASRMCSHGLPGVIQVTEQTYRFSCDKYECVPRGLIEAKGKGGMNVWHVLRAG